MAKALIKAGLRLFCSQTSEDRLSRVEIQIEKAKQVRVQRSGIDTIKYHTQRGQKRSTYKNNNRIAAFQIEFICKIYCLCD